MRGKRHIVVLVGLGAILGWILLGVERGGYVDRISQTLRLDGQETRKIGESAIVTNGRPTVGKHDNGLAGSATGGGGVIPHAASSSFPLTRPKEGDSLEDILKYKRRVENGEIPEDSMASRNFPATPPFEIEVGGGRVLYHAALNEVYVPNRDGKHEIIEIPPVANLVEWQQEAERISPEAEIVLYRPELPRTEANALMLGSTLILAANSEGEARTLAADQGLQFVRPLGDSLGGRYLVSAPSPRLSLEALLELKMQKTGNLSGNYRKVLYPRASPPPAGSKGRSGANSRFIPNDASFSSQWHLYQTNSLGTGTSGIDVNVVNIWDLYKGGGITVGIVDDGLQLTHPDLMPNLSSVPGIHHDWNDSTPNDPSPGSLDAHGTSVAGVVAARGNNLIGVSGVAPEASLAGLRLTAGPASDADEADAFGWKNATGSSMISVKNNSWGPADDGTSIVMLPAVVKSALASATSNGRGGLGTVFVWANGNGGSLTFAQFAHDSSNYDGYANSIYVISVAALAADGKASYFTEKGGNISVCAPSSGPSVAGSVTTPGIVTTDLTGLSGYSATDYTTSFGGTSASSPMVAGVVALMLQANPTLSWRDVKEILIRTARPIDTGDAGWVNNNAGIKFNPWYGAGLVDAEEAVNQALVWENLQPMTSASASKTGLSLLIPDNKPEGVTVDLPISANFRVESVAVTVTASHLYRGDMVFSLISPSGTQVRLTGGVRYLDSNSNLVDVTFTTPFLWGESSAGTWQVKAADEWIGLSGKLNAAAITVYGSSSPVAPTNDNFDKAALVYGKTESISTSNRGAGREKGEPKHASAQGGGSLWWKIQPRESGYLTIDTVGSSIDTLLALYQGNSFSELTELVTSDDISSTVKQSRISRWAVQPGEIYMLAVDGKNRERGAIRLNFSLQAGALFDQFADAKPMTGNVWSDDRSNAGYTAESGEPSHAGVGAASKSVWYKWTPQVAGTAAVDTRGSALDTRLGVYLGTSVNRLALVASNDNDFGRTSSKATFGVRAGENYYIAVDGKNGASGNFKIAASLVSNSVTPSPTNDPFASPLPITNAPLYLTGSNVNATSQTGETAGTGTVWYEWTAPKTGVVTMTTEGSLFDTTLGAFSGASVSSAVILASVPASTGGAYNDNAVLGSRWSRIRFQASAGGKYLIRVAGVRGATGRYKLNISY